MDTNKYIAWCSFLIIITIGLVSICVICYIDGSVVSSPVEEMYHNELVNTIDSILDARYGSGCCIEDTIINSFAGFDVEYR